MKSLLALLALAAAPADLPKMEGGKLKAGESCYTMAVQGKLRGTTWQAIKPARAKGKPAWDITVHQLLQDGSFDMRDHFIVERDSLLPIRVRSWRGRDRSAKGWHRVTLDYGGGKVTGSRESAAGKTAIDVALDGPTWDGNLWGVTFAALPLKDGGSYALPFWQYDKGKGSFAVRVMGSEMGDAGGGAKTPAWIVEMGDNPQRLTRYVIAKAPRAELGYAMDGFAQTPGGDCRAQAAARFSD
jgi:hypothetical protein